MTSAVLLQIIINLLLFTFVGLIWSRVRHLAGDEGKLRQGLQILHAKLAILEDLSQQIDDQYRQLAQMIDIKARALEDRMDQANILLQKFDTSLQDAQVSPETLLERETALRYIKAALLSHHGYTIEEVSRQASVGMEEASLIHKLNNKELQFKVEELPTWMLPQLKPLMESVTQYEKKAKPLV